MRKFWEFKNMGNEAELILYGEILDSRPWFEDGDCIVASEFLQEISNIKDVSNITIRLNSGGGDVFTATAIYTQLKMLKAKKTIIVDGIAASAATIILMAGDVIKMPANAMIMIHNPSVTVYANLEAEQAQKLNNALTQVKEAILASYMTRTNLPKDTISQMMDDETWLTGKEAQSFGFADEILFEDNNLTLTNNGRFLFANNIAVDVSKFKNPPLIENIKKDDANMDINEFKNKYPQIYDAVIAEASLNERNRIKEIEDVSNTIDPSLLVKAKFEEPMDAKTLCFKNALLQKEKGINFLNGFKADNNESGVLDVGANPQAPPVGDPNEINDVDETKVSMLAKALGKAKG